MRIVIATPHARYRELTNRLSARPGWTVLAVTAREQLDAATLAAFEPDFVFFPHWSWRIPATVYDAFDCVIFHMADVPYGRGGSPLQNLIRRGHDATMLSALRCVAKLDAGPVYLKRPLSLLGTAEEIFTRAATVMEGMIVEIGETRPAPLPQHGDIVTFQRLTPDDGNLADAATPVIAFDRIRMLDAEGYPPAFVVAGPFRIEFSRASLKGDTVLADARIVRNV